PLPAPDPTANTTVAAAAPATSPAAGTPDGLRPQRRPRSAFARFGPSSKARRFVPAARSVPCAVPPSRPPDSAACPLAATSAPRLLRTYPLITSLKVMQSSPVRARQRKKIRGPSASLGMTEGGDAPQNPHLPAARRPASSPVKITGEGIRRSGRGIVNRAPVGTGGEYYEEETRRACGSDRARQRSAALTLGAGVTRAIA